MYYKGVDKMDEEINEVLTEGIRLKKGSDLISTSVQLPKFMLNVIADEATFKNKSISQTIVYLIYSGLKAHVGEFKYPNENSINKNYLKRGQKWMK